MNKYTGKVAFGGIAIGNIVELKKNESTVKREHVEDCTKEEMRFENASQKAIEQLKQLYNIALKEVGESNAAIFKVHRIMLTDDDYVNSVKNIINTQFVNAQFAVATTSDNFSSVFESMDGEYMRERAADIRDISNRVIKILNNFCEDENNILEPSIIVADDLSPSETVQLNKEKVLAFVTRKGSTNSHTAILARAMNIPAIVNANIPNNVNGRMAVVNGNDGFIVVDPDKYMLEKTCLLKEKEDEREKMFIRYKGIDAVTKSGRKIDLCANIWGLGDIATALSNGAMGIGLFRSEFLYLQESYYPSEEKQFQIYKQVAEMMGGKKVIIRTLDIGTDKQIDYFGLDKEENPALGYRAVRICLSREDVFKTQIKAILRASAYGNISIMIPMIISMWEIKKVKQLISEVKYDLNNVGICFDDIEFGVMIETPAAVMMADEFAKEVDFFSIGTNDLTQYTLAIDRQNQKLDLFYDPYHPAIIKMIEQTVQAAHNAGIWVGICGELAGDVSMTEKFVELEVDELSVSPSMILPLKKKICECE